MMEITTQVSRVYGISPFAVMNEDASNVIMLINYLVQKGEDNPTAPGGKSAPVKTGRGDGFWNF